MYHVNKVFCYLLTPTPICIGYKSYGIISVVISVIIGMPSQYYSMVSRTSVFFTYVSKFTYISKITCPYPGKRYFC